MRVAVICCLAVLAGCTSVIEMKNPQTGAVAKCGPYAAGGLVGVISTPEREAQCIRDYQRQGYERAS